MGQSICERSSTERRKKMAEEVEEALLAIHVASNGSQESTDPNCSFRLQDPRGIQGLEGRFRVCTRFAGSTRARPASATTTAMRASSARAETTMTSSFLLAIMLENALVLLFVHCMRRRGSTSCSRAWQRGGIARRDCRRCEWESLRLHGTGMAATRR